MHVAQKIIAEDALPPEGKCLLAAARHLLQPDKTDSFASLTLLDWGKLLELASLHALTPAVARYLGDTMPDAVRDRFMAELANVRAYNFFLLQELVRVTNELKAAGIEALAWKGPALAVDIYPDIGLRPCADIDLLIPPAQMSQAVELLGKCGYVEMLVDTGGHTRNFTRTSPQAIIELHQAVAQPRFSLEIPFVRLSAGHKMLPVFAGDVPVPKAELLLLLLCAHAAKHHWDRLIWVCDIVAFIQKHTELDWQVVLQTADELRVRRMLNMGLLLADALCAKVVPAHLVAQAEADLVAVALSRQAISWLLIVRSDHRQTVQKHLFHLRMRESLHDRWPMMPYLILGVIRPTDADHAFIRLPAWFTWGYYFVRPVRLAAKLLSR